MNVSALTETQLTLGFIGVGLLCFVLGATVENRLDTLPSPSKPIEAVEKPCGDRDDVGEALFGIPDYGYHDEGAVMDEVIVTADRVSWEL